MSNSRIEEIFGYEKEIDCDDESLSGCDHVEYQEEYELDCRDRAADMRAEMSIVNDLDMNMQRYFS